MVDGLAATHYRGSETLEVVGESFRQENIWAAIGQARTTDRVRADVIAILVPETDHPADRRAVSVWVSGLLVGYLSRNDAELYRPGLEALATNGPVALSGVVVGGGYGGIAMLGVFLEHDPQDFGLAPGVQSTSGEMRTGLSHAFQTDRQDDSYDLSWFHDLPGDTRRSVSKLRTLLETDPDPIDRHFMFAELESRLYRLRDLEPTALADYDTACAQHDAEMVTIRPALLNKFGSMPLHETYKQQCIRQQKLKSYAQGLWWAERGLSIYGEDAHSKDWTDDLKKRAAWFQAKLETPANAAAKNTVRHKLKIELEVESLTCSRCGSVWERIKTRGRKPLLCPMCAQAAQTSENLTL